MNKNIITRLLCITISIFCSSNLFGQIIENDQVNPSVKWEQIQLKNHRIIFPKTYRDKASTLAQQLDSMRQNANTFIEGYTGKIPVILHANHIIQNGFVQLAPRKTEFFPLPSGIASNVEWLPNLAQHELRHVAQIDKLTGRLRRPFFEQFSYAMFGIHLPAWYFEGDAVFTETHFSIGGRGRMPSWFMPIRANQLAGRRYGFDKNILGSFKDITPSFYLTGYLMNTHLTNQFGGQIKEEMLEEMRGKLFRPFNFYKALRKHSNGYNSRRLYQGAIDSITQIWRSDATGKSLLSHIETPNSKYPVHYLLPQKSNAHSDTIYALWQGPQNIPHIVSIQNETIHRVAYTGQQLMPYFHVNDNILIWDEVRKDARYGKNTFQVVHIKNLKTDEHKTFELDDFVYTPALSPNNQYFTVVRVDNAGQSALQIYETATGKKLKEIQLPQGLHIQQPQYDATSERIVCIAVSDQGTTLAEFNLSTENYKFLLPWGNQTLERPIYDGENIIYKAHYNGIDNIYSLDSDGKINALSNVLYGAFSPTPINSDSLLINDYTPDGYRIAMISAKSNQTINRNEIKEINYDRLPNQNRNRNYLTDFRLGKNYAFRDSVLSENVIDSTMIRPYNSLSGLFNFHSLSISNNNFESLDNFRPGVFWLANDLLNTSQITLGYEYDTNIQKSIYSADFTYAKYFPKFSLRYENRGQLGQARTADDQIIGFDWRENYYAANVLIPFSIYRQNMIYSYGVQVGTSYLQRYQVSIPVNNFQDEIAFPLNYQAYFNRNRRRSHMDLQPRWGQQISATYRHRPFMEGTRAGTILSLRTGFYFPGLFTNHGLQARLSFQHKNGVYQFSNDIPVVSGFGYFPSPRIDNTLLLTYRMPIAYPDWAIGPLAYIKRIQAKAFSDYQNLQNSSIAPKTFGLGVSADFNLLRYVLPDINVGVEGIYINDSRATQRVVPVFSLSYSY